jgi:hypothetical protein
MTLTVEQRYTLHLDAKEYRIISAALRAAAGVKEFPKEWADDANRLQNDMHEKRAKQAAQALTALQASINE